MYIIVMLVAYDVFFCPTIHVSSNTFSTGVEYSRFRMLSISADGVLLMVYIYVVQML